MSFKLTERMTIVYFGGFMGNGAEVENSCG